jgi:hypothetical protein
MDAVDDPTVAWKTTLDHLQRHPHDTEGWRNAITISQKHGIKEIAETYQVLLRYFPNTVRHSLVIQKAFLYCYTHQPWAQIAYLRILEPTMALEADLNEPGDTSYTIY